MRAFLTTAFPMLAVAIVLMVGGRQFARKTSVEILPVDRQRLDEFSQGLEKELKRLETFYQKALADLPVAAAESGTRLAREAATIDGVRSVSVFERGPDGERPERALPPLRSITVPAAGPSPPGVLIDPALKEIETGARGFRFPASIFETELPATGLWTATPSFSHKAVCLKGAGNQLVFVVIDFPFLHRKVSSMLWSWAEANSTPLRESGTCVELRSVHLKSPLLVTSETERGPAASRLTLRSNLGDFDILAWDSQAIRTSNDPAILAATSAAATIVAVLGLLLFRQQRRATRLAMERVSFVNQVSHELGTPLTNLNLNLDLAERFLETNEAETRRRLGLVREELARLSRLVSNVLSFSKREQGKLQAVPEPCLPSEILRSVIDGFLPSLTRLGMEVRENLATTPALLVAPDALARIASNLISNAEKYGRSGGVVTVTLEHRDGTLRLTVSDRGPGIPEPLREKIFEPFHRVSDQAAEGVTGMGLGLAIARDLATAMQGTLELLPSEKGATFQLSIPAPFAP
jgi:signal transduction histidine kinase